MLRILQIVCLTFADLFISKWDEESDIDDGVIRGCTLLLLGLIANAGFVLVLWFPATMDALARHRNTTVFSLSLLGLPLFAVFKRLVRSARKQMGDDEIAAHKVRQRLRAPALLYILISCVLYVGVLVHIVGTGKPHP
jgi:hypothetical protein